MTISKGFCKRLVAGVGAASLTTGLIVATAPSAEAATACVYAYHHGKRVGSACFTGQTGYVHDYYTDGVGVYGTFGIRGVGVVTFGDANGGKGKGTYRHFSGAVTSISVSAR